MLGWAGYQGGGAASNAIKGGQQGASDAGGKGPSAAKQVAGKGKK